MTVVPREFRDPETGQMLLGILLTCTGRERERLLSYMAAQPLWFASTPLPGDHYKMLFRNEANSRTLLATLFDLHLPVPEAENIR